MRPNSAVSTDIARRLWKHAASERSARGDVGAAAERVLSQLRAGLRQWIGAEGYRALLDRALVTAEAEHPALGGLAFLGGDEQATVAEEQPRDAEEVAAGMVALVAAMIELLGGIIGDEMAVRLVEQIGMSGVRGVVSTETRGGLDG